MTRGSSFGAWNRARIQTLELRNPAKPKNTFGTRANREIALEALRRGVVLRLDYDGLPRFVEVHTVGDTRAGRPAMSVYQVDGQSHEYPPVGWRLMCFDECFNVGLTGIRSSAPHPEYSKRSRQFSRIDAEV